MFHRLMILALLVAFVAADSSAQNRFHRRRGAIFGGLAGAAIGAAIGDRGNNETAGALIGGAVGAIAGSKIGDQKDRQIEQNMRYQSGYPYYNSQPTYYTQQPHYIEQPQYVYPHTVQPEYRQPVYPEVVPVPQPAPPINAPISPDDVVAMTQSGLSDTMIIQQIELKGVTQRLTVSDVIQLHQLGVREPVISAMQGVVPAQVPNATGYPVYPQPYPSDGTSYRVPTTNEQIYGPSILNSPQ